ncbi:TPA: inositol monophosphatase family protein [Raoultella planticola]
MQPTKYTPVLQEIAREVRPIVLRYFRSELSVEIKEDNSPVTEADKRVEIKIREIVARHFPLDAICGEEFGGEPGDAATWIIDPVDGTKAFVCGFPLFGTLTGIMKNSRMVAGMISVPVTDELWLAEESGATTLNGAAVQTSRCRSLSAARICTTSPDDFAAAAWPYYQRLAAACQMQRMGGGCYAHAMLASGHADLVVEYGLGPWDFLPLIPVVEGAGGIISDWAGQPLNFHSRGDVLVSANAELHASALNYLREYRY